MVLDTSALLAVLLGEPGMRALLEVIDAADQTVLSAASFVEASIALEARFGADGVRDLDRFLATATIQCVSVDLEQAHAAREAFRQFGKGRHAAGLNFGDCFAYALAQTRHEPLLFTGRDFALTDVIAGLPAG
ncbi:MAG: type II toxin-antitoxin system VapC family toxin [Gammaproteobacteria bacterium]|nr:type II toxin-antitoxin system VapC family toxin [Gammaproteobacteria bacterium]